MLHALMHTLCLKSHRLNKKNKEIGKKTSRMMKVNGTKRQTEKEYKFKLSWFTEGQT
jgi:hypothetical protein